MFLPPSSRFSALILLFSNWKVNGIGPLSKIPMKPGAVSLFSMATRWTRPGGGSIMKEKAGSARRQCVLWCVGHRQTIGLSRPVASSRSAYAGKPPLAMRSVLRRSPTGHWARSTGRYFPLGVFSQFQFVGRACARRQCVLWCANHRKTNGPSRLIASFRSACLTNYSLSGSRPN